MLARHNEVVRDDYEALRKRYDELLASHSQAITKLELAQDENNRLTKKCEELTQERNNVVSQERKCQCKAISGTRRFKWDNSFLIKLAAGMSIYLC